MVNFLTNHPSDILEVKCDKDKKYVVLVKSIPFLKRDTHVLPSKNFIKVMYTHGERK